VAGSPEYEIHERHAEIRFKDCMSAAWHACLRNDVRSGDWQASKSIARYGVHAVVANILEKRKEVVHLVRPAASSAVGTLAGVQVDEILRGSETFIEAPLVARIVLLHEQYQQNSVS